MPASLETATACNHSSITLQDYKSYCIPCVDKYIAQDVSSGACAGIGSTPGTRAQNKHSVPDAILGSQSKDSSLRLVAAPVPSVQHIVDFFV